ncbi:MAG TPA: 3-hydroxyacyl-CoA dehydrogenase family protein, partial [Miltoncostaeaceae bacterium]|nr:3-hydroxyacyl-CoA dehydrogenase family protein [Miltoncostaeaceae bacterium]
MEVGRLGVVGAGVMGSEIAWLGARAGLPVVLRDVAEDALAQGVAHTRRLTERAVARGALEASAAEQLGARITTTIDDADLAGCDLVVEAVPETMEVKLPVLRALDAALPPAALIASNTSGLSITGMARATSRPDRVLGLHFFNPASRMELVEVVAGADTSPRVLAAGEALARRLGKTPVRVRECPGFLVNRVLVRAMAAAYRAAREAGVPAAEADRAVTDLAPVPMGPFALGDLIGLDTLAHIRGDLAAAYGARFDDGGVLDAA